MIIRNSLILAVLIFATMFFCGIQSEYSMSHQLWQPSYIIGSNRLVDNISRHIISQPSRGERSDFGKVTVTAYDLSVQCCGKPVGHPGYGITVSGTNLSGKSRKSAMTIAADPRVLPMGTTVEITFTQANYKRYNGIYTVADCGGSVKNRVIDLFMGDFNNNEVSKEAVNFGRTTATINIIPKGSQDEE
jgi:3D (Asp-Asp-Asp) domain-containing protein